MSNDETPDMPAWARAARRSVMAVRGKPHPCPQCREVHSGDWHSCDQCREWGNRLAVGFLLAAFVLVGVLVFTLAT